MTRLSAAKKAGLVFALCAATAIASAQTFTSLFSFDGTNGAQPDTTLIQGSTGDFYGAAGSGGDLSCDAPYGCGTIFRITPNGRLTTLHNFEETDGLNANQLVLATDGNFYGTTRWGGDRNCNPPTGCGTIFRLTPDGRFAVLHTLEEAEGGSPTGMVEADGSLYGTTVGIQGTSSGTIFKITLQDTFTTLYTFCADPGDCEDGSYPAGALVQGTDGQLYGTTSAGGRVVPACDQGCGTIFRITTDGRLNTLHRLYYLQGEGPTGALVQGTDGSFYGTAAGGGANNDGTVFKITQAGLLTVLHTFSYTDGTNPVAALIQATDGNLYGTTRQGGGGSYDGTIFQITPDGSFATLYRFCGPNCNDGGFIVSGLLQATNGVFYGTAVWGGENRNCYFSGCGTVYSLDMGLGPFVTFVRAAGKVGQTGPILGQGFIGTTNVAINGIPGSFTVVSDTLIRATVPAGATTGFVTVTTPSGTLTSNVPFHVIP